MNEGRSFKPKITIESLSDLIFGLALSVSGLTLVGQPPANFNELLGAIGFFGFSFLILISVWRSYSSIISVLPAESETLINLNILLLFVVSVEPYLFNQLYTASGDLFNGVSMIYAIDLATMFLIIAFLNNTLAKQGKNQVPESYLKKYRLDRNFNIFTAIIFLISIAPIFEATIFQLTVENSLYEIPIRACIWLIPIVLGWTKALLFAVKQKGSRE